MQTLIRQLREAQSAVGRARMVLNDPEHYEHDKRLVAYELRELAREVRRALKKTRVKTERELGRSS